MAAASVNDDILLSKLKEFIPEKRPNYIKVIYPIGWSNSGLIVFFVGNPQMG